MSYSVIVLIEWSAIVIVTPDNTKEKISLERVASKTELCEMNKMCARRAKVLTNTPFRGWRERRMMGGKVVNGRLDCM
ncbi:7241_t:CDS:2 [Acaulospora colombiana]|uniref:7241_t:CDS:1 n=1 Tax=Acaulospora colombiana TaxID=27376 RepID=A0ACA9JXR7_9GLOM|nr:7241_t:CDS:2 [Acaulospora colombiana]